MSYSLRSRNTQTCCGQKTYRSADDNYQVPRCAQSGVPAEDCQDHAFKEGEDEESDREETNSAAHNSMETDGSYCQSNSGRNTVSSTPSFTSNNTGAVNDDIITENRPSEDGTPADLGDITQPQHPVTPGPFPSITHDTTTVGTFPVSPIVNEPDHGPEFPATEEVARPSSPVGGRIVEDITPAIRRLTFETPSIEERLLGLSKRLATLEAENAALKKKVCRLEGPEFSGDGSEENPIMFLE